MKDLAVRLYKNHDLDLIALYKNKTFAFKHYFIKTLESVSQGKSIVVPYPQEEEKIDPLKVNSLMFRVEIPDEVHKWLKSVPFGYQNQFVKNIFRSSFNKILVNMYFEDGKISINSNKKEVDKTNKEVIDTSQITTDEDMKREITKKEVKQETVVTEEIKTENNIEKEIKENIQDNIQDNKQDELQTNKDKNENSSFLDIFDNM